MKVSIITICYNNERDIRDTIESVIHQTYGDIEYIVKDGGSKDGTMSIVNEYRDKISQIISCPDKGIYDAINQGIFATTGDVVGLIHAGDCLYDNNVIANLASSFMETGADIVYGSSKAVGENGGVVRVNIGKKFQKRILFNGYTPPIWVFM